MFGIDMPRINNLKTELLDIKVVIGRGVAYGIVGALLTASFIGLNLLPMSIILAIITNALLGLFWTWGAPRLRDLLQPPLEEKWITGWYDSDKLLNNIAKGLVPVSEREEAFKIIAGQLKDTIKIKEVSILLGSKKDDIPKPQKYVLLDKEEKELDAHHPFIVTLQDVTHYNDLTAEVKESIKEFKFLKDGLYLPLFSTEVLEGIAILGRKKSEDPYNKRDYTLFRTLMVQALAILDRIHHYESIKREFDTTQKKLYDTERFLARSERIASLGSLIREYNHEIRTPLTVIKGRVEELPEEPRDLEYLKRFTDLALRNINRINDIVETTLRLSGTKERKEVELDLNAIINSSLQIFPPSGVHLIKELNPLPPVKGDKEDLQLVFVNLIKNAVEAMPEGGNLKIITSCGLEDSEPVAYAEVSDTGVGIPEENREKIFEPFFSTHVTKGRGLGLSIVFRIVREHLGKIEVKSKVGVGSTFKVQFRALKK